MRKLQEDIKLILDYCNVERAMNFEERKAYNRLLDFTQLHSIYQSIPVEDRLNEQEETIQNLLKYKYLVKALEEINKTYIEELISDWTDEAYSDKEEQLRLGKYHSENGLSWEDKEWLKKVGYVINTI